MTSTRGTTDSRHGIVPPYLLKRAAEADARCGRTLQLDERFRARRAERRAQRATATATAASGQGGWRIHTAENTSELPGTPVRDQDQPASDDKAVDEAWEGVRAAVTMFAEVYQRDSYDGAGARVLATVHYERDYANAFWDGDQLVFGDGDGEVFQRFTKPMDVGVHEFSHAVVEHTSALVYSNQSGALNESVADCFASAAKQRELGQSAEEGDWLIGAGLFAKGINGKALRSMKEPGTAYDDPALGKDPQPGHMDDYISTTDDNGGVHLNSGIPNRAFYLAATGIGGSTAEGAGRIWYAALQAVDAEADFAAFAAATVEAAGKHADAVRDAWKKVGVNPGRPSPTPKPSDGPSQLPTDPPRRGPRVRVTRSGGFAGLTTSGSVDLDADDEEVQRLRAAVGDQDLRSTLHGIKPGRVNPDSFQYAVTVGDDQPVVLTQDDLDQTLRQVVDVALRRPE